MTLRNERILQIFERISCCCCPTLVTLFVTSKSCMRVRVHAFVCLCTTESRHIGRIHENITSSLSLSLSISLFLLFYILYIIYSVRLLLLLLLLLVVGAALCSLCTFALAHSRSDRLKLHIVWGLIKSERHKKLNLLAKLKRLRTKVNKINEINNERNEKKKD